MRSPLCSVPDERPSLVHIDCASHVYPDGSRGMHAMCFAVHRGEVVAVCGANGSGKSTLIEHLNGTLVPAEGRVQVLGETVDDAGRRQLWRRVGVVFQDADSQLFAPTVVDDVAFGPMNLGLSPARARQAALEALEAVGAAGLAEKIPAYMSGGEKRLAAIAGVLAMHPEVIAFDEPTSDLDPAHAARVEGLIAELRREGQYGLVLSTHDLDFAARIADRVTVLKHGSVIADGPPRDLFYDADLLAEAGLVEPRVVRLWRELCRRTGRDPGARPVTEAEFVAAFADGRS